jgi:hypothetical protein
MWVMDRENSNLDVRILVLIRPADSLHPLLSTFLRQQGHDYIICSSIYEVLRHLTKTPGHQTVLLISRPGMLSSEAENQINRHFKKLWTIGWLDDGEQLSDLILADMLTVSHVNQLGRIMEALFEKDCPESSRQVSEPMIAEAMNDRLRYEISDDEMNALFRS